MRKCIILLVFITQSIGMFAQHDFNFIVLRDYKWINMSKLAIEVIVNTVDSSYRFNDDWGVLSLGVRKDDLIHQVPNDINITVTIEDGWEGRKKSVYSVVIKKDDIFFFDMLMLNVDSKIEKINYKLYKKCRSCVEIQQCRFSIDGCVKFEIDSILCVSSKDTIPLFYSIGKLYIDSTYLSAWYNIQKKERLSLLLYNTNRYYEIPFSYIGKDVWYVFIRNRNKKKYNVGWWDCNRLSYRSILDLYGRKGAFH